MSAVFIIGGYGVPQAIQSDDQYKMYLTIALNTIVRHVDLYELEDPIIIFSGGATDCFPPYKRTEAEEMRSYFTKLFEKTGRSGWQFFCEKRSISTLENVKYSKELIERQKIKMERVTFICEFTRRWRVGELGKKLFSDVPTIVVEAVDFDTSPGRYKGLQNLLERERAVYDFAMWALDAKENEGKHHQFYAEKLEILRKFQDKELRKEKLEAHFEKLLQRAYDTGK